ncbi:MAG TPA: hypothetical protein VEX68_18770 [Bryobacteraceae bacterium]|nr:hypothetical protein [Bryobacteraceae bacterium]
MRNWFRRLNYLINRLRLEKELAEEMAAHQELMDPLRRNAFGNALRFREQTRDIWGWKWVDDLRQDLQHGIRGLVRDHRIAVSALLAIALAVGAATAVFSVVDRSLFRPLPYQEGDRLVTVGLILPSWGPAMLCLPALIEIGSLRKRH